MPNVNLFIRKTSIVLCPQEKITVNTMMNTKHLARNCCLPRGEKGDEHQAESSERLRMHSEENFVFGAQGCSLVSRQSRK